MIARLLIANRGEIAVRIARACRELGIESVAVYSDADADAAHVAAADRAVRIGPAEARASYLDVQAVIDAARATHADAVHPGYGFLSENEAFAEACERAGLIFVGPPAGVIARMGSKIEARRLAERAGVPVVPGVTPDDQSDTGLSNAIREVGLPALIKASAGGGGRGMRRIANLSEAVDAIQSARREAQAAFSDGTLYVERLIEHPHHVEVQVMADAAGNTVHVFERECSVQRRHQKVIEESPSPNLTPELRARITGAAVRVAQADERAPVAHAPMQRLRRDGEHVRDVAAFREARRHVLDAGQSSSACESFGLPSAERAFVAVGGAISGAGSSMPRPAVRVAAASSAASGDWSSSSSTTAKCRVRSAVLRSSSCRRRAISRLFTPS